MEAVVGSIDRVKLKTEVLRFTAGVTSTSSCVVTCMYLRQNPQKKLKDMQEKGKS